MITSCYTDNLQLRLSSGARSNGRHVRQTRSNDRRGQDAGLVQLHAYTYNTASLYSKVQTKRIQTLKYGNRVRYSVRVGTGVKPINGVAIVANHLPIISTIEPQT